MIRAVQLLKEQASIENTNNPKMYSVKAESFCDDRQSIMRKQNR